MEVDDGGSWNIVDKAYHGTLSRFTNKHSENKYIFRTIRVYRLVFSWWSLNNAKYTQRINIYFAQLGYTDLYSPDYALIKLNIYRERFSECLFVKLDQVFPL